MNKLSKAIEQAKNDCLQCGSGEVELDNIKIYATWEDWEEDNNFDVVTIYISNSNIRYQLEETAMES